MVRTLNQENQVLLTPAVFPILVFYLKADGSRILIDTGAPNPALLSNVLRQAGIGPREIDTVILTHLHFDHCANSELFPRARFFLQRREWDFAQHPDPSQRDIYLPELMAEVQQRDLLLVDGDCSLPTEFRCTWFPVIPQGNKRFLFPPRMDYTWWLVICLGPSVISTQPSINSLI